MRICNLRWPAFSVQIALLLAVLGDAGAGTTELDLRIDQPRPLAGAVLELDKRHNLLITYEDPQYEYAGDLHDYASEVRTDLLKYAPDKVPPVIGPAAGIINLRYTVSADTGRPADVPGLVRKLIDAHNAGGALGIFTLDQSERYVHVVPLRVRNSEGEWQDHASILSVPISIPQARRTTYETLKAICSAVSERAGVKVDIGTVPLNLVLSSRAEIGATNELARSVLTRTLNATETDLDWLLLFDPGVKFYALNLLPVATRARQPATPSPLDQNQGQATGQVPGTKTK
jgi:hypothetical protein